ncbi:hypothetical protein PHMEG_0006176 [Phytophthora megakarya]|uniref:Uncharacterized protein n=1 Tax=Phytophthora megakarya TaxID=4795 RepID=A0A225WPI2_9STRA|nr:hypothetical protein PHMEG_0006176 [Phytophthora megakarya]
MADCNFNALDDRTSRVQSLEQREVAYNTGGKYIQHLLVNVVSLCCEIVAGREQDALDFNDRLQRLRIEAWQILKRHSVLRFEPLSKIQRAVISSQPFACCAPPRRNEWEVSEASTPAAGTTRSKTRLTCVSDNASGMFRSAINGISGDSVAAVGAAWAGSAMASTRQVAKSTSGKIDSPCSSDVFTRTRRRKRTFDASTEMFLLWTMARSEARPNRYHRRQSRAAS